MPFCYRKSLLSVAVICGLLGPASISWGQGVSILESPSTAAQQPAAEELPLPVPAADQRQNSAPASSAPPPNRRETNGQPDANSTASEPREAKAEFVDRASVHEAFAVLGQPVVNASQTVFSQPPSPISELPPSPPQSGNNMTWIGGYWAWHAELEKFIWITGLHREVPPGRRWVAGSWFAVPGGYRWASGFWADASSDAVVEVPKPPTSYEAGPSRQSRTNDSFWLPGGHVWNGSTFELKEGFWTKHQDKFIWQPASYVQTATGYVYVSGYWDFELSLRGMPHAPISLPQQILDQPDLTFTPEVALASDATLHLHLFAQPNDTHLYFGDFYKEQMQSRGFQPWYSTAAVGYSTSQWLSYYRWKFARQDTDFDARLAQVRSELVGQPELMPKVLPSRTRTGVFAIVDGVTDVTSFSTLIAGNATRSVEPAPQIVQQSPQQVPQQQLPSRESVAVVPRQLPPQVSARVAVPPVAIVVPGISVQVPFGIPSPRGRVFVPPVAIPTPFGPAIPGALRPPFPVPPFGPGAVLRGRFGR